MHTNNRIPSSGASRAMALATASIAALIVGAGAAQAADGEDSTVGEIVVTGSRIARTTFTAPSPVTVLGAEQLEDLNVTNVGQVVSQLPAFRPSNNPTTNGFGSFNVGAQIVNLRGLGVNRNLVLLDGRRFSPVTREWTVDLNLIPSLLVQRTEVVTGGASAAYGSDAIAGVVNVVLDKSLDGLRLQADYGVSGEGDGDNYHLAGAFGTDFAGERGHFIIGAEYDDQKIIGNCFTRSWCRPGAVLANGAFNTPAGVGNGMAANVRSDDNAGFWPNTGSVITTVPGQVAPAALINLFGTGGVTFDASGNAVAWRRGTLVSGVSQIGGDIVPTQLNTNLMVPTERFAAFGHADYDFNDSLSGFVEGSYGYVTGSTLQAAFFDASIPVFRDNPFIPASVRAIVGPAPPVASGVRPTGPTAAAATAFNVGRLGDDLHRGFSTSTAKVYRFTAGLEGRLNDNWQWDAYYQYGRTDRLQTVENNRIQGDPAVLNRPGGLGLNDPAAFAYFQWATDAVVDNETVITPATGQTVCRATLSPDPALRAAAAGCAPLNLLGTGRASAEAIAYVYGDLVEDIDIAQHVVAANLRGDVAELWAGPLSVALGGEYRHDAIDVVHDDLSNLFAYFQNFGADYDGTAKILEGYVEAELPLAKDMAFAKSLTLNGAVRYTHYSIEGFGSYLRTAATNKIGAATWKASLVYDPTDWLKLRATRSRDIRAPNFAELFLASASNFGGVINRFVAGTPTQFPTLRSGGDPTLHEEKADTWTVGGVFTPKWGLSEGLRVSLDYYDIKVKDFIASPGTAQFVVDQCFAGITDACGLITFGTGNSLVDVRTTSTNLDELRTRGIDIEAEYRLPFDRWGGGDGDLTFRVFANHVMETTTEVLGTSIDRAGQTGNLGQPGLPKWLVNAQVTFNEGPTSLTMQGRYIAPGTYNAQLIGPTDPGYATTNPLSISDNHVGGAFYLNVFGSFNVIDRGDTRLQLFGSVLNLLDKQPPSAPELQYPTNPVYFDQIGRQFRVGMRFAY